jgi:tetratricopeptide (TPR) repeat protein
MSCHDSRKGAGERAGEKPPVNTSRHRWLVRFMPLVLLGLMPGLAPPYVHAQPPPQHQPSMPLPVLPGIGFPPKDASGAEAAVGGTPYLDLLKHYRAGDYEHAVKGMAVLREGRSSYRVFEELDNLASTVTGETDPQQASRARQLMLANAWAIAFPAAAALHLETGFSLMQAGEPDAARDHLHVARLIVDHSRFAQVMKIRPELSEEHARFRRDIYLGVLWALQTDSDMDRLVQHLDRVIEEFPGDGLVALAVGSFEEYQSSSAVIRASRPPTALMAAGAWRQNTHVLRLKNAEKHYREALKIDSSLVEARLRLGRVLQQRGLMQDARDELEGVFSQPEAEPAVRYLASMFLIDVLEAQGNTAASLARARDLVTRYPECQSAHLAFSRALEARGQRVQALAALGPLWKEEPMRRCADPWWSYYMGQARRVPTLFESLRARVRSAK